VIKWFMIIRINETQSLENMAKLQRLRVHFFVHLNYSCYW